MSLLTTSPVWIAGAMLLGLGPLLAVIGVIVVRRSVPLSSLRTNNEVAGFKFATVGVLYAVLLAFAVLVVWEKLNEADATVAREASAAATLFRLSLGMEGEAADEIRAAAVRYLETTIAEDWPAMARGGESRAAVDRLNDLYVALLAHEPRDPRDVAVFQQALGEADQLSEARRSRIVVASGVVPDLIWLVLFLGAGVTIGFTFFFGTENLRAQATMTGALALLISSGLLTIVGFDRPFAGTVRVEPGPLALVLEDFGDMRADP
jgi:hypothetical protein